MGIRWVALLGLLFVAAAAWAQDPREIVRRSIAQDQLDWTRMKDYTWQAHSLEKHFDSHGNVQSTKQEKWESLILDGRPHRRILERDGKPVSAQEQRREEKKLDDFAGKATSETPTEKQHRL